MSAAVRNLIRSALIGAEDFQSGEPVEARLRCLAHEILTENFEADSFLLAALLNEAADLIATLEIKQDKFHKR